MSLVDSSYGSDDDDDVDVELPVATTGPVRSEHAHSTTPIISPSAVTLNSASSMIEVQSVQGGGVLSPRASLSPTDSAPPRLRLPDVSELLGPSALDVIKTSEVQKKRPATNGSGHSMPRSKVPRGNLQPSRNAPDTAGGLLTPPQLRGSLEMACQGISLASVSSLAALTFGQSRSNVATEDLDKIFSRKQRR